MAEGRRRDEWQRASLIAALIHNQNASKRAHTRSPSDFDPFLSRRRRRRNRITTANITDLQVLL